MAIARWIIDKRWVVYERDQEAAIQKFWAYYPASLGPFSDLVEDTAKDIVQDGFYRGLRSDEAMLREPPIDLRLSWSV